LDTVVDEFSLERIGDEVAYVDLIIHDFLEVAMLVDVEDDERFRFFLCRELFYMSVSEVECVIVIVEDVGRDSVSRCFDQIFQTFAGDKFPIVHLFESYLCADF